MSEHRILFYEYVEDMVDRRGPHRPAHLDRIEQGKADGLVVMAGALGDPPYGGAIVFRDVSEADIEAWARADPYVQAGLVTASRIELWTLV